MPDNPFPRDQEQKVDPFYYPSISVQSLCVPQSNESVDFWKVLQKRRSERVFNELSIDQLSKVLWHAAKVQQVFVQDNGYILTQRPSPSAGARHPIDILIISSSLSQHSALHYYNPFTHALHALDLEGELVQSFCKHIGLVINATPTNIIWFIAHPMRTAAKYENSASLIWRDAGALIQNFQLICSALNIHSCPIGSLGEPFVSDMFKKYGEVFSAGGLIIG